MFGSPPFNVLPCPFLLIASDDIYIRLHIFLHHDQTDVLLCVLFCILFHINHVIIIKTKILLPQPLVTLADLVIMCRPFDFLAPKT